MSDSQQDDALDISPWPVIDIVGRAVCLASVARRGFLDFNEDDDPFMRETDRFELASWARSELANWITPAELELLDKPVNPGDRSMTSDAEDALAQATTIAWALRVIDLPELSPLEDESLDQTTLDWAPLPWNGVRSLTKSARLRSDEELAFERERHELWEWRSHADEISDTDLADVVAEVEQAGLIPVRQGDFAIPDERLFASLSEFEQHDIAWLSQQRLKALNWVCGLFPSWDQTWIYLDET